MKMRKNALASTVAAGLIAGGTLGLSAPAVSAPGMNLDAGMEISNIYLYRGEDLGGGGLALVAGWLEASHESGAYIGTWAASGDGEGTEIDLYAGYGFDITEDVSVDLNITNFIFPTADATEEQDGFGDFSEVGLGVSAYGVDLAYYNNIAGASGYQYYSIGYGFGPFSALVGVNDFDSAEQGEAFGEDMTHLDLSYAFNDNLSFTVSTIVDSDEDDDVRRTALLEAMYTVNF